MNKPANLAQWLQYIQQLHPEEIEMGLERLRQVALSLGFGAWPDAKPAPVVITVTGTNGKGSHVATLDALLRAMGYRVGSYTSPHLLSYNERVVINGRAVDDQSLIHAFARIEEARAQISLSYFEFGTLAALMIFEAARLDVVILEVGLGGRLDAVNLIDADVAVVSSIGLDHQEWLGNTRESVAREKSGIFRPHRPVVCTEPLPPANLLAHAAALECPVYLIHRDFDYAADGDHWQLELRQPGAADQQHICLRELPLPALQLNNVSGAVQAALAAGLLNDLHKLRAVLPEVLSKLQLAGRLQWRQLGNSTMLLDVSHNPQAAEVLANTIASWRLANPGRHVHVVLAMMHDKDHAGYCLPLETCVDFWYIAHFELPRCMPAAKLADRLTAVLKQPAQIACSASVEDALLAARTRAGQGDLIVVSGSFFTVAAALNSLPDNGQMTAEARPH